jgi:hypothetical protein
MTTKTGAKTSANRSPAAKAKPVAKAAQVPVSTEGDAMDKAAKSAANAFKLPDLIELVAQSTGGKKKDIKATVEATLSALGASLAKGDELNLPGLGKIRVARSADKDGRAMMVLKLRGPLGAKAKATKEPLAEPEEEL